MTNTVAGTTIGTLAQNLMNLINATSGAAIRRRAVTAADFFEPIPMARSAAQFFLYASTPGWPASQILATLDHLDQSSGDSRRHEPAGGQCQRSAAHAIIST